MNRNIFDAIYSNLTKKETDPLPLPTSTSSTTIFAPRNKSSSTFPSLPVASSPLPTNTTSTPFTPPPLPLPPPCLPEPPNTPPTTIDSNIFIDLTSEPSSDQADCDLQHSPSPATSIISNICDDQEENNHEENLSLSFIPLSELLPINLFSDNDAVEPAIVRHVVDDSSINLNLMETENHEKKSFPISPQAIEQKGEEDEVKNEEEFSLSKFIYVNQTSNDESSNHDENDDNEIQQQREQKHQQAPVPSEKNYKQILHYPQQLALSMGNKKRHLMEDNNSFTTKSCPSHIAVECQVKAELSKTIVTKAALRKDSFAMNGEKLNLKRKSQPIPQERKQEEDEPKSLSPKNKRISLQSKKRLVPTTSASPKKLLDSQPNVSSSSSSSIQKDMAEKVRNKYMNKKTATPLTVIPKMIQPKVNCYGYSPLHIATNARNMSLVNQLINADLQLVNSRDNCGRTPLHIAAAKGDLKIAERLLIAGADANSMCMERGMRPLHEAMNANSVEMVKLLLRYGANPHCALDDVYVKWFAEHRQDLQSDIPMNLIVNSKDEVIVGDRGDIIYGIEMEGTRINLADLRKRYEVDEVFIECPSLSETDIYSPNIFTIQPLPKVFQSDLVSVDLDMDPRTMTTTLALTNLHSLIDKFMSVLHTFRRKVVETIHALKNTKATIKQRSLFCYFASCLRRSHDTIADIHFKLVANCLAYLRYLKNIHTSVSVSRDLQICTKNHAENVEVHARFILQENWKYLISDVYESFCHSNGFLKTVREIQTEANPLYSFMNLLLGQLNCYKENLTALDNVE